MVAVHGLIMMIAQFFVALAIGVAVLVMLLVVLYFAQDAVKEFFLRIWRIAHKESYTNYRRREEAEKKFEENA